VLLCWPKTFDDGAPLRAKLDFNQSSQPTSDFEVDNNLILSSSPANDESTFIMANRTVAYATAVHGTNAQYLIEKIIRERIKVSKYWQEECFRLTSAMVLERAVDDLKYIGGTYGAKIDPTPFLCLTQKLLQIQPQKEIIYLYIDQPDFKYLRALGAFYLRLVGRPVEIYKKLEPIYNDYRKLRIMDNQRKFSVIHMDEFIDNLLHEDKVFNITLPRLTKRIVLEDNRDIEPYKSELEEQNLIPTQLIEERVERQRDERKRRDESPSYHNRDRHSYKDHREKSPSSSSYGRSHKERDRHDRSSRHRDSEHTHHRSYRDSRRERERDHKRSRSRSPVSDYEKKLPSKYSSAKGRFSKEMIANENAIRAKLGLKPLK
jgi:pre-mRNA-splicing factor 38A